MLEADWEIIDRVNGWMSKPDCEWLSQHASQCNSWTEIGTLNGRSMLSVGLYLKQNSWLQMIDPCFGPEFWTVFKYLHARRPDLKLIAAECFSWDASFYLPYTDTVFIDGDHTKPGIINDIERFRKKCRWLCGHDYYCDEWPDIRKVVNQYFPNQHTLPADFIWIVDLKEIKEEDDNKESS